MDADLQHDETILPSMLQAIETGAEVVVGTRYAQRRQHWAMGCITQTHEHAGNAYEPPDSQTTSVRHHEAFRCAARFP